MYRQWDGNPLGLGLVAEDKPSEFSCTYVPYTLIHTYIYVLTPLLLGAYYVIRGACLS